MDNPQVTEPRQAVPGWAKSAGNDDVWEGKKITPAQRKFLLDLIDRKSAPDAEASGKLDTIVKCLRISEDPEELGMTKSKASQLIDWFLKQPDKPRAPQQTAANAPRTGGALMQLPAGRYAVDNAEGELRFYQCWESRDGNLHRLYVQHSDDTSRLPMPAQQAIAQKILDAGVRECAIRYGLEIGSCSNCGRTLTNRISRELGIGPVCGGRMFGDEFKSEVKSKRAEIKARGEDPDEELS